MADNIEKLAAEQNEESTKVEKETQSQILIKLASDMELFHTEVLEPFATLKVNSHYETWSLNGGFFKLWLTKTFYDKYGKVAGNQTVVEAINILKAKALFEGEKKTVFTRIAEKDNTIYIDLCNESWEVVKVTSEGWEIVSNPPVKFKRSKIAGEIPEPIRGGSIEELKKYINYKNETDWVLIVAWLLSTLRPNSPYPILTIQGEQGSAKSTTTRVLRTIVDPSTMPLRSLPKEERDLSIAANNSWILAFDNLSGLSNMISDALCKLSTGGGLATRMLFTDDEEAVFNIMRPAILNGIDDIAKRQDLLDRSLVLFLPSIPEEHRTDEKNFWELFKEAHPRILGGLLDVLCGAIKELPNTNLTAKPRMADFAQWATAAEKCLGWETGRFINVYNNNRNEAIDQGLESDPVAVAVQAFMKERTSWEGTVGETLDELSKHTEEAITKYSKAWPTSRKLKERFRRIAPALRAKGINFLDLGRLSKGSTLRLEKTVEITSLSTLTTPSISNRSITEDGRITENINVDERLSRFKTYHSTIDDDSADNVDKKPHLSKIHNSGLI
ncbi:hypothetical protein HFZ78_13535 [Priestia megaterium]|uniref:ATP-binding protein n=1 Tax=Priestia megaterium TaxID=1404 RepID=A0A6H1P215_PRIMG|nr:hypothetical protein [Priestia megaterium]QIZ07630.1 hypothetical protein HFZ78_13535 [Priestia megaterium]